MPLGKHYMFNKDGKLDFVITDSVLRWYRNNGGSPPSWTRFDVSSANYMGTAVGDYDGDGDLDISSGSKSGSHPYYWWENNGSGGGWTRHDTGASGDYWDNARSWDYNGDGRDDLIIEHYGGDNIYYCQAPADKNATWSCYRIGGSSGGLCIGDVDKDGDRDVISGGKVFTCPANPAQANWPSTTISAVSGYDKCSVGDMNKDGNPDIAFSQGEGSNVKVAFGPNWTSVHTVFSSGNNGLHTMHVVDFDKDGDGDIFTAEIHNNQRVFLFENANGLGTSWTMHEQTKAGCHNGWVGDFNGDGWIDLIGNHFTGGQISIWYNTLSGGGPTPTPAPPTPTPTRTPTPTNTPVGPTPTPVPGLPSPWQTQDIGAVAATGSASYSDGVFTVKGSGADIWGTADEFRFVYQTLNGDGQITARVTGVQNTTAWAKAGVMIRETLDANSKHAMMVLTPGNGLAFQRRISTGGSSSHTSGGAASAPYWVRMVRSGNTFTAYKSSDGTNWTQVGSETIGMATSVYVGLAVTSHNDGTLCTATFDNVSVGGGGPTPTPVPPTATPTRTPTPTNTPVGPTPTPVPPTPTPSGDGLIAWWKLDESSGTTAADSAGANTGTLVNGPVWRPTGGRINGALEFDGSDDRVDVGNMDIVGSGLTIALWMKADDFDVNDARFVSKATGVNEGDHYWMVSTINGTALRFRLKAGGSTTTLASSTGQISAGTWYHIAVTYDGSQMRIYKNGTQIASVAKTGTINTSSSVPAALGNQPQGGRAFDGLLDDVRIYNRALSQAEIQALAGQ